MSRTLPCILSAAAILTAPPLFADTITYTDGKVLEAIVERETDSTVTVTLYGQRVEIPRNRLESIERATGEANRKLAEGWKQISMPSAGTSPRDFPPAGAAKRPLATAQPPTRKTSSRRSGSPTSPPAGKRRPVKVQDSVAWNTTVRKAIREKRVIRGMTEREVRSAWGWPERTHPVHGIDVDTDRWTYRRKGKGLADLYFENGKLIDIHD